MPAPGVTGSTYQGQRPRVDPDLEGSALRQGGGLRPLPLPVRALPRFFPSQWPNPSAWRTSWRTSSGE